MAPLPDLDSLLTAVTTDAGSDEPLDQLAQAARSAVELEDMADALLGHFVEACRASGCSWADISDVLGVSRQAAHKRFAAMSPTFERFTPRARAVLAGAVEQARSHGHSSVGTEHLLLALFEPAEALAAVVLRESGLTRDAVERQLPAPAAATSPAAKRDIGYSPAARNALRAALDEALALGHNYIGTEHLLLALYADGNGAAARALLALGLDHDSAEARLTAKLDAITGGKKQA